MTSSFTYGMKDDKAPEKPIKEKAEDDAENSLIKAANAAVLELFNLNRLSDKEEEVIKPALDPEKPSPVPPGKPKQPSEIQVDETDDK